MASRRPADWVRYPSGISTPLRRGRRRAAIASRGPPSPNYQGPSGAERVWGWHRLEDSKERGVGASSGCWQRAEGPGALPGRQWAAAGAYGGAPYAPEQTSTWSRAAEAPRKAPGELQMPAAHVDRIPATRNP